MDYSEKIKAIMAITGKKQETLAKELGVTFAAFNRWVNNKSKPRPMAQTKINNMLVNQTGMRGVYGLPHQNKVGLPKAHLILREEALHLQNKKYPDVINTILKNPDIRDQIILSLTYHSNKIEGSTLSEAETASIIFHNIALKNKTITEQVEAKNHQAALIYMFNYVQDMTVNKTASIKTIDENFILKIHAILMNGIRQDAGQYRNHGVRIVGSFVPTANHMKLRDIMSVFAKKINSLIQKKITKTLKTDKQEYTAGQYIRGCAKLHAEFEQIHPFSDGNGRVGRIILNAMLLARNLPPAVILQTKKAKYYSSLNNAQLKGQFDQIEEYIADAVIAGYRMVNREIVK